VAHGALSSDCRLIPADGKRVELGPRRDCAERFIGPSIDDAIDTCTGSGNRSTSGPDGCWTTRCQDDPRPGLAGLSGPDRRGRLLLRRRQHPHAAERVQRLQPRHRRPRPRPRRHPVETTQRPSADTIATSLRGLFGCRWAFDCSIEASSDTILGHSWANQGYSVTEIDPQARGVGWLRAEEGIPAGSKPPTSPTPTSST
jgi:DNA segregation ATPase FtsK/SpoIIIE, S-DNA-T family